jgi:hypothetical protein
MAVLASIVRREAYVLAYIDAFWRLPGFRCSVFCSCSCCARRRRTR